MKLDKKLLAPLALVAGLALIAYYRKDLLKLVTTAKDKVLGKADEIADAIEAALPGKLGQDAAEAVRDAADGAVDQAEVVLGHPGVGSDVQTVHAVEKPNEDGSPLNTPRVY